jgi:general secretion pathway protein D
MKPATHIFLLAVSLMANSVSQAQPGSARPQGRPGQAPTAAPMSPAQKANLNTIPSVKGDTNFAKANPEDITNENFPNLIESFDYPNADIAEIVKAISKLTGKNFILDKGISGKISIIAPSQITVAEAYKAFLTALAMNGFTIVPSGSFLKIRRIQDATKENIDTYSGSYFPNADQLITRIIKLRYINAEEVQKTLNRLINQSGDITPYAPTNSLIVTDLGSNVERITTIINQLDVPGFEEKLVVIPIRYARSKDIADLIDQIINKGDKKNNQFSPGVPRFRSAGATGSGSGSGAANYSLVIPDLRTNSIIVVGNDAGIERIRDLVKKLDFRIRPEDGGGVWVYYVRYGESEKIANVLNGIATESSKSKSQTSATAGPSSVALGAGAPAAPTQAVFGGDVKVSSDKDNNSLIITASKQDYEVVRAILAKIDIPRDQVFVKAIIMEMNADDGNTWGVNYYKFQDGTNGVGRAGLVTEKIGNLTSPTNDNGLTLGFGTGGMVDVSLGGSTIKVPSLLGLIRFIKTYQGGNILSTPQITALDNEEALIEVGEDVPVSTTATAVGGSTATGIERKELTLKLKLTPYISPDTDSVRMKIDQKIKQLSNTQIQASELQTRAVAFSTRTIETNIVVNSEDTAVLGGLMEDKEDESVTKVPILGDIPILGWLFKGKTVSKKKKNLLVFITPKILRNSQDNADLINAKLNERIDFIQQNLKGRDPHGAAVDKLPRRALIEEETEEYIPTEAPTEAPTAAPTPGEDDADSGAPEAAELETLPPQIPGDAEEGE